MMSFFYDVVEDTIAVFMDDLFIVDNSFDHYFIHFTNALLGCEECNLVLNL